jgi:hypothetical protein
MMKNKLFAVFAITILFASPLLMLHLIDVRPVSAAPLNYIMETAANATSNFISLFNNSYGTYNGNDTWNGKWWQIGTTYLGNPIYVFKISKSGDVNNDDLVDILDAITFANQYRHNGTSDCDFNKDHTVNIFDSTILSTHYTTRKNDAILPLAKVIYNAELHGGEHQSATLMYNLADWLLSNDTDVRAVMNEVQIYIVPTLNYDCFNQVRYAVNHTTVDPPSGNITHGIDLNKNFKYNWGEGATSDPNHDPSTNYTSRTDANASYYIGQNAASEAGTQALRELFAMQNAAVFIDWHNGGANTSRPLNRGLYQLLPNGAPHNDSISHLWWHYHAVSENKGETYEYDTTNTDWSNFTGTSDADANWHTTTDSNDLIGTTIEIWSDGVPPSDGPLPTASDLNGTALNESKWLTIGIKNYIVDHYIVSTAESGGGGYSMMSTAPVAATASKTTAYVNETLTVTVGVSSVTDMAAWQFGLYWNKTILNCTDVSLNTPPEWADSTNWDDGLDNDYNTTHGAYERGMTSGADDSGVNGTCTFATLTFKALAEGDAGLGLEVVKLVDRNLNIIDTSSTSDTVTIYYGRYMRIDTENVNGLNTYLLNATQTTSSLYASTNATGGWNVTWGIRAWVRHSNGTEQEITLDDQTGTPKAQVERIGPTYGSGIQNNTVSVTQKSMQATDSLVVRVYIEIGSGNWTLAATFTTEQLGATTLTGTTWTVYYWTIATYISITGKTYGRYDWGDSAHDSRIQNLKYT